MPGIVTKNPAEDAMVEYLRAQAIVDVAQIDGRERLAREATAAAQAKQEADAAQILTAEQRAILALPCEQQQALAEHRALLRLQALTATKTVLVAQATAAVESAVACV